MNELTSIEIENVINDNIKMIYGIVRNYQVFPDNLNWDDCVQAGRLAILESLLKFNPNKGTKLSSYMYRVIKSRVLTEIMGGRKDAVMYDNQHNRYVQYKSKKEKPQFIPLTETIDDDGISSHTSILSLNNKDVADYTTPLINIDVAENEDIYTKVSKCLADKYGETVRDMILAAFDNNNVVSDNYQFIYNNYHLLKPYMSQRANPIEKMSCHQKHIWNFRLVLGRLAQKALKEDKYLSKIFGRKNYVSRDNILLNKERTTSVTTIQQIQNGKVIAEYPTIVKAARITGIDQSTISKAVKYNRLLKGFKWRRISNGKQLRYFKQ